MSRLHLKKGSVLPALQKGLLRVYSMRYCPFAQRTLLILEAKGVEYQLVNVNLKFKPDWLFAKNPRGKVPILEQDEKFVVESLVTCDFLDEKFPDPPMYSQDIWKKYQEKTFIQLLSPKITVPLSRLYFNYGMDDSDLRQKQIDNAIEGITFYDSELKQRGTPFYGGEKPGMLDYMFWPWLERIPLFNKVLEDGGLNFEDQFPSLKIYIENMLKESAVRKVFITPEEHMQFAASVFAGENDYDIAIRTTSNF